MVGYWTVGGIAEQVGDSYYLSIAVTLQPFS